MTANEEVGERDFKIDKRVKKKMHNHSKNYIKFWRRHFSVAQVTRVTF